MNKLASGFVVIGLSALALSGCAAASAADGGPSAASRVDQSRSTLTEEPTTAPADAATAAIKEFSSLNQAPLGDATALIEEQFPSEFAYAFFDDASAMHVAFAGTAPAEAVALLEGTDLPYVVTESVGFNAAEYQAAAENVGEQTRQYVTGERQVQISQDSALAPGAIKVSFQSEDARLRSDPGLVDSISVDEPFKIIFDFTNTSPVSTVF